MREVLNAKAGGMRYAISFDSIIYMEKDRRKIIVHTPDEEISFYGRFDDIMPLLDERFMRPHCSYVINMEQICRLGKLEAVMSCGSRICLGQQSFSRLRKSYDVYIASYIAKMLAKA